MRRFTLVNCIKENRSNTLTIVYLPTLRFNQNILVKAFDYWIINNAKPWTMLRSGIPITILQRWVGI